MAGTFPTLLIRAQSQSTVFCIIILDGETHSNILLFVSGLLADQTTRFPNDVAVSAFEQFERKIDWLYLPTGLLKSSSARGGAKYSMLPFISWNTQVTINYDNNIPFFILDANVLRVYKP